MIFNFVRNVDKTFKKIYFRNSMKYTVCTLKIYFEV